MKKITCVLAILGAASTAALAKDLKATTPAVSSGTQMSDAEMDKVTAAGVANVMVYEPGYLYVLINNNGQAPELQVAPDSTRSIVCVNKCLF